MPERFKPVIIARSAEGLGPFACSSERHPWAKLIYLVNEIVPHFFGWPQLAERDGDLVERYRHVDVIFPRYDGRIVVVVPKTITAEKLIRRALKRIHTAL